MQKNITHSEASMDLPPFLSSLWALQDSNRYLHIWLDVRVCSCSKGMCLLCCVWEAYYETVPESKMDNVAIQVSIRLHHCNWQSLSTTSNCSWSMPKAISKAISIHFWESESISWYWTIGKPISNNTFKGSNFSHPAMMSAAPARLAVLGHLMHKGLEQPSS